MGMDNKPHNTIIAEGQKMLENTDEHREAVAKIRSEVLARYEPRLRSAGPLRKWVLHLACRIEINRRVRELTPPETLYMTSTS